MTPESTTYRDVLAIRPFRLLFAAHALSLLGGECTSVGLALLAYHVADEGASKVLGLALTLRILAFVLISPFAGALADRVSRRALLVWADLIRVGVVGCLSWADEPAEIYALIFALNLVTAIFTPTYKALIPGLTGEARYLTAVSLSRIAYDLAALSGPILAAGLIAVAGFRLTFLLDAASFLVSAGLILAAGLPRQADPREAASPWRDALQGARTLLGEPVLRYTLILSLATAFSGAALIVNSVTYSKEVLRLGDGAYGLLVAAAGLGSILGAVHAKQRQDPRWRRRQLQGGALLVGAAALPFGLHPDPWATTGLWFALGYGQSLSAVPAGALLGERIQAEARGRTFAAHFALTHAFWLLSYPLAGYSASWLGAGASFTGAGLLTALITLMAALSQGYPALAPQTPGLAPAGSQGDTPRR